MGGTASLLLALAALGAFGYDQGQEAFEDRLLHAPWEDRLRVVRTVAGRGPDGLELLKLAAQDSDWQVRAAAAEGLGRAGPKAEKTLARLADEDRCRLVRLAAAHALGRLGAAPPADRGISRAGSAHTLGEGAVDDTSECASSYLPASDAGSGRAVKSRDSTRPDEAGCSYLRFQRLGNNMCPGQMTVHGIGRPPDSPKLLKMRGDEGGVALCCPSDESAAPEPVEVECRLIPEECPPPWQQMDEPGDAINGKEGRYRRSQRHHLGDLDWVQCCRPVPVEVEEEATAQAEAPSPVQRPRRRPQAPAAPLPPEEPLPPRTEGPSPESLIAKRALEKRAPETLPLPVGPAGREDAPVDGTASLERGGRPGPTAELDMPAALGGPEVLPPPRGAGNREDADVEAAARLEKGGRAGPKPDVDAGAWLGKRDGALPGPKGPDGRADAQVTSAADIMPDGGLKREAYDPLPVLIEKLAAPEAAIRARAAEMIGSRGAAGRPAVKALLAALKDENARVRSDAALALGGASAGTDDAVPALRRLLRDRHPDVRYSAATALGRVGTPAAERAFSRYMSRESKVLRR